MQGNNEDDLKGKKEVSKDQSNTYMCEKESDKMEMFKLKRLVNNWINRSGKS